MCVSIYIYIYLYIYIYIYLYIYISIYIYIYIFIYIYIEVTYSQVHGSLVLKALSFKRLRWNSATTFAEFIQFGQNAKVRRPRNF